jgi:hypothetical protein
VIRAPEAELDAWRAALAASYVARRVAFAIPAAAAGLRGLLAERPARGPAGTAYVCEGLTCRAPIDTPAELAAALGAA